MIYTMKFTIIQALKKAFAFITTAIMTLTGGASGRDDDIKRPDTNTVTPYSTEISDYTLTVDVEDEIHDISDLLFGIFFEDINFAADGGLYAEMVVNRSFEFTDLAVKDANNCYFSNIGGWGNTVSCLQQIENGAKTKALDTVKPCTIETGRTYEIKVVVEGAYVECYLDGELYAVHDFASEAEAEAYQVVSTDESGDIIIKIVNVTDSSRVVAVDTNADVKSSTTVHQIAGDSLANDNILGAEEDCITKEFTVEGFAEDFGYTVPAYSVTCIRLERR